LGLVHAIHNEHREWPDHPPNSWGWLQLPLAVLVGGRPLIRDMLSQFVLMVAATLV